MFSPLLSVGEYLLTQYKGYSDPDIGVPPLQAR